MINEAILAALLAAIAAVESQSNDHAIGAHGERGAFQIAQAYLDDANRFMRTKYKLKDMEDRATAGKVVRAYLRHWGHVYEKETGKTVTPEILARIHNGGPYGYLLPCTLEYWEKVKKEMEDER